MYDWKYVETNRDKIVDIWPNIAVTKLKELFHKVQYV